MQTFIDLVFTGVPAEGTHGLELHLVFILSLFLPLPANEHKESQHT